MTDRTAEEILDDLNEDGTMPTTSEVVALCDAAVDGIAELAKYGALEHALELAGWGIVDMTTDDTDGTLLRLVPPESDG